MKKQFSIMLFCSLLTTVIWAQSPQEIAARLGYPQKIVYNAKIVTVDDASFNPTLGTIAQAMAIRDKKILAVGSNTEIRALAGPQTQLIDLRGRTVVPGFILVHNHPFDYVIANKEIMQKVLPEELAVQRFLTGPPREQMEQFPQVFEEAVGRAKPGAWIRIVFLWAPEVSPEDPYLNFAGTRITKEQLDRRAPNNPVVVRARQVMLNQGVSAGILLNQKAVELVLERGVPDLVKKIDAAQLGKTGVLLGGAGLNNFRMLLPQVVLKDHFDLYTEIQRLQQSWWTGKGQTTVGGFLYHHPNVIRAFRVLDQQGRLPARVAWGWGATDDSVWERAFQDPFLVADLASREGTGTDYMWYFGTGETGGGCVSMEPLVSEPKVLPGGPDCTADRLTYRPGGAVWNSAYQIVKSGGRLIASHQYGDVEIDSILNLIEQASRDGGLTTEQIRARRHNVGDHMQGWPRPDQIPRIKELGGIVAGTNMYIYVDAPRWLRDYGEKALDRVVPRKSMVEAGIMNGMELDKPYLNDATVFTALSWSVTREAMDGKVYAPHQKISREIALKTGTIWGAYYVLKEDVLGSLEPGKLADFLVLDKDYLTVPEEDIDKLRILMAAVGGKVEHLVPSLAKELGMEPRGAQVELGGPAAGY